MQTKMTDVVTSLYTLFVCEQNIRRYARYLSKIKDTTSMYFEEL